MSESISVEEFEDILNSNGIYNGIVISPDGVKSWYDGLLRHREDGPAVIFPDGEMRWYRHGSIHREDGPAMIREDGSEEMWLFNKLYSYDEWAKILENHLSFDKLVELKCRYG